jgi:hypothetical protein
MSFTKKAVRNRKKSSWTIQVDVPAIPENPKIPATTPNISKTMGQTKPAIVYHSSRQTGIERHGICK